MKKSIFLFFAAILCAMSVSAKVIYFKPNGNWVQGSANFYAHVWGGSGATSPVKFTPVATDPDVYEAEVGTHTSIIFLRMNPSKAVTSSNMWTHSNDGGPRWDRMGNLSIPTDGKNCCAIKEGEWSQEKDDASSSVTWSTYTPPTVVVIPDRYITGTLAGGWNANEVKMTYDEVTETYSHTFTAVAANAEQKIKVTDGTWTKSWGGADVSPAIDGITTDGDGNVCFTLKTAGDVTITFKDSKIQVTTTGAFKVPVTYPYYILGTMNSWSVEEEYGLADEDEDGVYTREITLAAGEHFFKINIGNWSSQWGWSNVVGVYTEATDASDDNKIKITLASEKTFTVEFNNSKNQISFDGLTKIEDYYTVVGVAELFGTAWDRASETNKMAKQGDGSYKLVKENVTLAAIGYDWKIAKNGEWWNDAAIGVNPSEGNNTLTITTAGRYNVTFTLAADLTSATVETELLEAAVVIPDCFISGNATLTGGEGWQGNEFTMVYDEETETWAYTLAGLQPEKEYELKVVCGGTWYSYADLASVPTGVTEGNDHSIAFKMAAAGDVVVTYNVEAGITLSGNFAEPAPEVPVTLYFVNAENWTNLKAHIWVDPSGVSYKPWEESESLTDTGNDHNGADIYSYTFSNKYNRIIWKGDDAKQTTNDVAAYDVAKPYYCQGFWYATLAEIPAAVDKKYYVKGTHNEWTADATSEMTLDGEVYKKEVTLAKDVEFKINDGADAWWGKDNLGDKTYEELEGLEDGNLKMLEEKTFTIIFNPAEHLITFEGLTEKAPAVISYVLMGVNGDWTTGIPLTVNPGNADEYVLTDQVIIKATDAIKVVTLTDGEATAWCGNVDSWSNATYTGGGEDNIVLEDGIYTFYFKKTANNIYINQTGYARNVTNTYGTICLPYAAASTTGAIFYRVAGKETGKVYLESVDALEAGVPYIFEKTASQITVVYTGDPVADPVNEDANGLVGTFTDDTEVAVGNYILYNNQFCYAEAICYVNANRAYLVMEDINGGAPLQMPGRRYIGMSVQGENETTGLDNITNGENTTIKLIENGQLIIIRGGEKFNAQGQKL